MGGISANTTEAELLALFSQYGQVKAAKIIQDRAGVSKGYGFITFESEDDARRLQRESDNIVLRERKLNIAPAIKKQPFSRAFDAASPPAVAPGNPQYFFQPSAVPFYQSGVTYYPPQPAAPGDPSAQQPVYQCKQLIVYISLLLLNFIFVYFQLPQCTSLRQGPRSPQLTNR